MESNQTPQTKSIGSSQAASVTEISDNLINELVSKLKKPVIEAAKNTANKTIWQSQFKIIESLGIFVALFTFISISIQIFSRVTSLGNAVLFIFLIFLCMIGFLFFLHLTLNLSLQEENSRIDKYLPLIALLLIVIIGYLSVKHFLTTDIMLSPQEDQKMNELQRRLDRLEGVVEGRERNSIQ